MEVDHVELVRPLAQVVEHREVARDVVADAGEAQALRRAGHELGRGLRIAAGEQRDVVTLADQLLGQPRDDALGPAVEARRNGLGEGSDLGNAHDGASWDVFRSRVGSNTDDAERNMNETDGHGYGSSAPHNA